MKRNRDGTFSRVWNQEIVRSSDVSFIYLYSSDGRTNFAIFDSEFTDLVSSYKWFGSREYIKTHLNSNEPPVSLYDVVMGLPSSGCRIHVDHINRFPQDCRRINLRVCSDRENYHNRSDQSEFGPCIQRAGRDKNSFCVSVKFRNGYTGYSPFFKNLEAAQECRDRYLKIASAVDRSERDIPDREELVRIVKDIKQKYGIVSKREKYIDKVLELSNAGMSGVAIARELDISVQTCWRWIREQALQQNSNDTDS